jgi:hypothetical protein
MARFEDRQHRTAYRLPDWTNEDRRFPAMLASGAGRAAATRPRPPIGRHQLGERWRLSAPGKKKAALGLVRGRWEELVQSPSDAAMASAFNHRREG